MSAISDAIERIDGGQAGLARELGLTPQAVSQWVNGHRPVPPRHALAIERATGGAVSRYALRPDVFGPEPQVGVDSHPSDSDLDVDRIGPPEEVA